MGNFEQVFGPQMGVLDQIRTRALARARENSTLDQGSGNRDQGSSRATSVALARNAGKQLFEPNQKKYTCWIIPTTDTR